MLSSIVCVQILLLCLQVSHQVSSNHVHSYEDIFYGNLGEDEVDTEVSKISINKTVKFWLYTKERPDDSSRLMPEDPTTLDSSGFDGNKPTKFLIHGWLGESKKEDSVCLDFKAEYFALFDYNVVCVDWGSYAMDLPYFTAWMRCKDIGNYIGEMIITMTKNTPQTNDDVHILGFSMGAHIAGFAGKRLEGKLNRITGLDPAKPLFPSDKPAERLDKTDAQFVDVVHTSRLVLGQHDPIGDIDFYPNDGKSQQPNCGFEYVYGEICSHYKSCEFYARSIRSKEEFKSIKCDDWKHYKKSDCGPNEISTYLGEYADPSLSGKFYLSVK